MPVPLKTTVPLLWVKVPELVKFPPIVRVLEVEVKVPELTAKFPATVKLAEEPAVAVPVVDKFLNVRVVPELLMVQPAQVMVPLLEVKTPPELLVKILVTEKLVLPVTDPEAIVNP